MSIVVATLLLSSPPSPELRVEIVSRHGAFVIEREDYQARMPIIHMPNEWKKARMIWSSHDGSVRAVYEDDGGFLSFGYEIRREIGGEITCYVGGSYAAFGTSPPRPEAWRSGVKGLRKALADRGGIGAERENLLTNVSLILPQMIMSQRAPPSAHSHGRYSTVWYVASLSG